MDNGQPYYVTYKFYDERGRRLSIFCIPGYEAVMDGATIPGKATKLFIWVLPCSSKDNFSKAAARNIFEVHLENKDAKIGISSLQIDVEDGKPKYSFLRWCEENYFKYKDTIAAVVYSALWRGDEQLNKSPMVNMEFIPVIDNTGKDEVPYEISGN